MWSSLPRIKVESASLFSLRKVIPGAKKYNNHFCILNLKSVLHHCMATISRLSVLDTDNLSQEVRIILGIIRRHLQSRTPQLPYQTYERTPNAADCSSSAFSVLYLCIHWIGKQLAIREKESVMLCWYFYYCLGMLAFSWVLLACTAWLLLFRWWKFLWMHNNKAVDIWIFFSL